MSELYGTYPRVHNYEKFAYKHLFQQSGDK